MFEDQEDEYARNLQPSAEKPNEDLAKRVDDISSKDERQGGPARLPFPHTPHRESVIFFSTGKKLLRAPCFELQDNSACEEEEGQLPSVQDELLLAHENAPCTSKPGTGSAALRPSIAAAQSSVSQCLRLHHRPRCSEDLCGEFCRGDAA